MADRPTMTDRPLVISRRLPSAMATRQADGGDTMERMYALFRAMERASILPKHVSGPADAAICAAYGAAIGLDPLLAVYQLHFIEGRPTLSADGMAGLVKGSSACEYLVLTESTPERATYQTQRRGDPEPTVMSFTIEEATSAGLTGRGNWAKYPRAMLRARAVTAICRAVYPDVCGGLYDPDELEPTAPTTPAVIDARPQNDRHAQVIDPVRPREPVGPVPQSTPALAYLSDAESALYRASGASGLPDVMAIRVRSSSGPGDYECQRLATGVGWHCTCEKGVHTKTGEHSECKHTRRAELRLAAFFMGAKWAVVSAQCGGEWDTMPDNSTAEAVDMWRVWRDAQ